MDSLKNYFEDKLDSPTASLESTVESPKGYSEIKINSPVEENEQSLIERVNQEINQAVNTMQSNIMTVGQRGEHLDALQTKTDDLATQANGFRRGANRVRKQMWWKDMKMRMCIIIGIIVLLVIIIVPSGMSHLCDMRFDLQRN